MQPTLRLRILLTVVPLLVLLTVQGVAGVMLLYYLGGRINAIIHENYDSVVYMGRLNEALERIDSSFQFALFGQEEKAREQYAANWKAYDRNLSLEQHNVTLPGEQELVDELTRLSAEYRQAGDRFFKTPVGKQQARHDAYLQGLYRQFLEIKRVSGRIHDINQDNMVDASRDARRTAHESLVWLGVGLAVVILVAGFLAWRTLRSLLGPIQAITESALNIGAGNLDQVVPVLSRDELGQLADAFNIMARQLRAYRQTNYARLIRAQQTSQATIDSFPDPVLVVDSEGHVEMANPAARRLLGVGDQSGERSLTPWMPPEPLRQPLANALRDQRAYLPEGFDSLVRFGTGGQEHSLLPRILPIRDPYGGTLGAAVLLQDVTRFRLLDEIKSDLVATVSHELKTPLTSVRLALHLLLEETVGPLTSKQTELLLDARDNAERLLARVNNLLDLARLEQSHGQLQTLPLPPSDLLQAAADTVRPRAEDKGVEIVVEAGPDLPPLAADPGRLGHALDNLLDNALRFTDRGGRITLKAASVDGIVTLTVADTGLGIPEEYLPRIFDKFFRIPGRTTGTGTGLGLAIVREIVTAHGGQVSCTSQPGSGTVFRLILPIWQDGRSIDGAKDG